VPARPRSGFAHPCFIHNPAAIKKRFEILRSYNAKTIISACLPAGLWIKHLLGITTQRGEYEAMDSPFLFSQNRHIRAFGLTTNL